MKGCSFSVPSIPCFARLVVRGFRLTSCARFRQGSMGSCCSCRFGLEFQAAGLRFSPPYMFILHTSATFYRSLENFFREYISFCMFVSLRLFVCLSVCLFAYRSVCLPTCLFVFIIFGEMTQLIQTHRNASHRIPVLACMCACVRGCHQGSGRRPVVLPSVRFRQSPVAPRLRRQVEASPSQCRSYLPPPSLQDVMMPFVVITDTELLIGVTLR